MAKKSVKSKNDKEQKKIMNWWDEDISKINFNKYKICEDCKGSGSNKWKNPVRCFTCGGDGYTNLDGSMTDF